MPQVRAPIDRKPSSDIEKVHVDPANQLRLDTEIRFARECKESTLIQRLPDMGNEARAIIAQRNDVSATILKTLMRDKDTLPAVAAIAQENINSRYGLNRKTNQA